MTAPNSFAVSRRGATKPYQPQISPVDVGLPTTSEGSAGSSKRRCGRTRAPRQGAPKEWQDAAAMPAAAEVKAVGRKRKSSSSPSLPSLGQVGLVTNTQRPGPRSRQDTGRPVEPVTQLDQVSQWAVTSTVAISCLSETSWLELSQARRRFFVLIQACCSIGRF